MMREGFRACIGGWSVPILGTMNIERPIAMEPRNRNER